MAEGGNVFVERAAELGVRRTEEFPLDSTIWSNLFESGQPEPGGTEDQLRELLESISRPLSAVELDNAAAFFQQNPYPPSDPANDHYVGPNPANWVMPFRGLPESYLAFLRWSNGGTFHNGKRHIKFWSDLGPRRMMMRYFFPEFAPLVIPFASNPGTGDWYGFDTSSEPIAGEFPVVYIHHEIIREYMVLAPTFPDFCRGTEDPEKLYWDWWRLRHRKK
jgi:hypothetical protein